MDKSGFQLIESMLTTHSKEAEAGVISFSRHLSSYPINNDTAYIYQKLLGYNNPTAVNALLKNRNPESFFSCIEPSRALAIFAFSTLTEFRSNELHGPTVLICLGIIQNIYQNPKYGVSLYSPSITNIYHAAKYLTIKNDTMETLLIGFLENICTLSGIHDISTISRKIIDAHFDQSKKIESIIPSTILQQ